MTLQETAQIMDILTIAYPQFYNGKNAPDPQKALILWSSMFADDDAAVVAAAIKALIVSDPGNFPPSIGTVKAKVRQITAPQERTEGEAWAIVAKAVRKLDWNDPEKAYRSLPNDIQRCVHDPSVLVDWAKTDENTFSTVIASNFQRSYRARRAADREYDALPPDIKAMIGSMTEQKSLEAGKC
jgi:hypothetical protein